MLGSRSTLLFLFSLLIIFSSIVIFELGMLILKDMKDKEIIALKSSYNERIEQMDDTLYELDYKVQSKEDMILNLMETKEELSSEINELNEHIAGLSTYDQNEYPFAVPSTGILGSYASRYMDENNGYYHLGVDIWTSAQNGGAISTHRGNPVYSACTGKVVSFQSSNGGVTISCYIIPSNFRVPARKVYTYYGHMANAVTKEQYIYVKIGDEVQKGQFIGYQGDLSMFTPGMRNVHLHFSIFTGSSEQSGHKDPCKYIGGSCSEVGRFFTTAAR